MMIKNHLFQCGDFTKFWYIFPKIIIGLWLQVRDSDHQRQIHAKINRVQIDNQLTNCWFPVVLAPVPPPKSVLADSIPKPFMELSVLQYRTEHTNMAQYKYVSALVQEAHLKVDQGWLNNFTKFWKKINSINVVWQFHEIFIFF